MYVNITRGVNDSEINYHLKMANRYECQNHEPKTGPWIGSSSSWHLMERVLTAAGQLAVSSMKEEQDTLHNIGNLLHHSAKLLHNIGNLLHNSNNLFCNIGNLVLILKCIYVNILYVYNLKRMPTAIVDNTESIYIVRSKN